MIRVIRVITAKADAFAIFPERDFLPSGVPVSQASLMALSRHFSSLVRLVSFRYGNPSGNVDQSGFGKLNVLINFFNIYANEKANERERQDMAFCYCYTLFFSYTAWVLRN